MKALTLDGLLLCAGATSLMLTIPLRNPRSKLRVAWTRFRRCLSTPSHAYQPVQRDAAEVQDGRRRQLDVQRRPDQAEDLSVSPLARGQLDRREGHHHQSDQQVRERQRHDEVVCLLLSEEQPD